MFYFKWRKSYKHIKFLYFPPYLSCLISWNWEELFLQSTLFDFSFNEFIFLLFVWNLCHFDNCLEKICPLISVCMESVFTICSCSLIWMVLFYVKNVSFPNFCYKLHSLLRWSIRVLSISHWDHVVVHEKCLWLKKKTLAALKEI